MVLIEILALIFLCKKNGELALQKGLRPGSWKIYTVIAWITAEFFGIIVGVLMFSKSDIQKMSQADIFLVSFVALFFAFGGYLYVRYNLEKKPDDLEEDVDHIGVDDLRPPPRSRQ